MHPALPDISRRIETDRAGPFMFQLGVDLDALVLPMQRVHDAHERFVASPLAQVTRNLEREVIAGSVFGTNTIEGGTLSEDETAAAINLDPSQVQAVKQRRVLNIKAAYDQARLAATMGPTWNLSINFIREIHALITHDLPHGDNRPGLIRNNPKGRITHVGSSSDGGRYKPPQFERDIWRLLEGMINWHTELAAADV